MKKTTINTLLKKKNEKRKITALTAYDYSTAKFIDESEIDIILVGDSLAMVALGYEDTLSVTVEEMLHHTKAVSRGVKRSFVVADMPFMSYQVSIEKAIENASLFIKEGRANAVKIEGCSDKTIQLTKELTEAGIPVLAHLGFTPQFLNTIGGFRIQGKNFETTKALIKQAKALEKAGAFGVVLEMVPEESAKIITENIEIPTIGIGAGRYCSGQILVIDDIIGKFSDFKPKFARKYMNLADLMKEVITNYKNDVETNCFPSEDEIFNLKADEIEKLKTLEC